MPIINGLSKDCLATWLFIVMSARLSLCASRMSITQCEEGVNGLSIGKCTKCTLFAAKSFPVQFGRTECAVLLCKHHYLIAHCDNVFILRVSSYVNAQAEGGFDGV